MTECKACKGTGDCPDCGGKGKVLSDSMLVAEKCKSLWDHIALVSQKEYPELFIEKCKRCHGTGECTVCEGAGKR